MVKFLPLLVLVAFITALLSYLPTRRELAYRLNLSGDTTQSCCNEQNLSKTGDFDDSASVAIFESEVIDYPKTSLVQNQKVQEIAEVINDPLSNKSDVLGTVNAAGEEKWIEVSLSEQKLRAWEGNRLYMEFPISSGKWAPTPKGDFNIWYKTRNQSMIGGSKALGTYYNLPNVPHNMFFYRGYAVHGAYWHNNFGNPMSHGCVNAPLAQVAQLFEWTGPVVPAGKNVVRSSPENPGTRVFVH
jgi:hypothetical protein